MTATVRNLPDLLARETCGVCGKEHQLFRATGGRLLCPSCGATLHQSRQAAAEKAFAQHAINCAGCAAAIAGAVGTICAKGDAIRRGAVS